MFLSENGHCVPNKFSKILKIFKGVEGPKIQGACFDTKELDHLFLGYSDSFDLAHGLAQNQSHGDGAIVRITIELRKGW